MTDLEYSAERDIARAAAYSDRSDRNLWAAGLYAARVIGTYERHAAQAIADKAGRDVSSVENWAHAAQMYQDVRAVTTPRDARNLRRALTLSHFWTAWELRKSFRMSMRDVVRLLVQMVQYKADERPHSAEVMRRELEAERGTSLAYRWTDVYPKALALAEILLSVEGAPATFKRAASEILKWKGETMQNLIQFVLNIRTKDGGVVARNEFQAAGIVNGLHLWEIPEGRRTEAVLLYREWREAKVYGNQTEPCFEAARKFAPVPQMELAEAVK